MLTTTAERGSVGFRREEEDVGRSRRDWAMTRSLASRMPSRTRMAAARGLRAMPFFLRTVQVAGRSVRTLHLMEVLEAFAQSTGLRGGTVREGVRAESLVVVGSSVYEGERSLGWWSGWSSPRRGVFSGTEACTSSLSSSALDSIVYAGGAYRSSLFCVSS